MARLKISLFNIWLLACGLIFLTPMPLPAEEGQRQELAGAGVCARCHVTMSLEWGIARHSAITSTNGERVPGCTGCHGPSAGHIMDEENGIKPDRIPRGEAIATLCIECHTKGCPQTGNTKGCQDCHDPHALVNPEFDPAAVEAHAKQLATQQDTYKARLAEGEQLAQAQKWDAAGAAFRAALKENPASSRAAVALLMCERRLKPGIPGFKIAGGKFDAPSGLPSEIVLTNLGLSLVLVPAGSFDMGSEKHPDTVPVHTVNIAPFYLGKFEMTQAQWKTLMSTNPSFYQGEKFPQADTQPVEQVSWDDCQTMLVEVNKKTPGGGFRLPTEAEWEYAARAGAPEPLPTNQLLRFAWLRDNSEPVLPAPPIRSSMYLIGSGVIAMPHPVGTREPNPWGLYDMLGNVSVWCSTLFQPYPYTADDGREAAAGAGLRVVRGANFADPADAADAALRHSDRPDRRFRWNGVRLAFTPPAPEQSAAAPQQK
jgi:formylglycine-generating enzyme required for sulfatase activity